MIKSSKHRIDNITNESKLSELNSLFNTFSFGIVKYVDLILSNELKLTKKLSSKECPSINGVDMASYKALIYKQASDVVRSQIDKANQKRYSRYKKVYAYFKRNNRQTIFTNKKFSELKLNDIHTTKYFTKPNFNNISIRLDALNRFFNFNTSSVEFDEFLMIKLPTLKDGSKTRFKSINVPLKQHRHSLKLQNSGYKRKNCVLLERKNGMILVSLIWEVENKPLKTIGDVVGVDMGYKKLIVTSEGQLIGDEMTKLYDKSSRKKRGSKAYKRTLLHRDNEINRMCNTLYLGHIKTLVIEDLKNVKKNSKNKVHRKTMNKMQYWSYTKTISKLEIMCAEQGVKLDKVCPSFTSQMCSACGEVNKESRQGEVYKCISCNYEIDADFNASLNIERLSSDYNKGAYSPFD